VYKPAFAHEQALDIIKSEKGKHFDPDIVDAFMEIEKEILQISRQFQQHNTLEE
jgi:putative two-component system response regulator